MALTPTRPPDPPPPPASTETQDNVASGDPAWDLASLAHRDGDERLHALLEGYEPDESLARRLPQTLPLYGLIHDVLAARVFHQLGWREQCDQAVARLRVACERAG